MPLMKSFDQVAMLSNLFGHCLHCHLHVGAVDVLGVVAHSNLYKPARLVIPEGTQIWLAGVEQNFSWRYENV